MQSIKLASKSKKCFSYFYLVPDSKLLEEEHEAASYNREAEELLSRPRKTSARSRQPLPPAQPTATCNTSGPTW
jgi:hypothetical protein